MKHPLSQLYYLDQALLRLERRIGQTPGSLEEVDLEVRELEENERRRREELEELGRQIRKRERSADELREKIRRHKSRLQEIQSPDTLQALQRETGRLEARLEELELQILEEMERQESREREARLRQEGLAARRAELRREGERLRREMEEYRADRERMAEQRERYLESLDAGLRRRYLHVFKGMGYTAISAVNGGACGGCGARLTPQRALDFQRQGELGSCQGCGRLLIGEEA